MRIKSILIAALLTILPIISFASDYYIATSDLNVRTGAGIGYSVSFTLLKGDEVELILKDDNWYKIKYLEKTGYVSSKYLKLNRTTRDTKPNNTNYRQIVDNLLIVSYSILTLYIGLIVYWKIRDKILLHSVTNKNRGTKSERDLVLKLLKYGIPKQNTFHDLYIEKGKSEFSQTDLVIVTQIGIIVFEVKDYSGWVYGNGNQAQWTKVLAYGKQKYLFYNPIMQNNKHIAELKRKLSSFENIPFFSIVVFYGDCQLKNINFVPNGTFIVKSKRVLEVVRNILKVNEPFIYTNENEVIRILREAVTNGGDIKIQTKHSENIKDMLGTHRIFD